MNRILNQEKSKGTYRPSVIDIFGDFFANGIDAGRRYPPVNIYDEEKAYQLELEIPGYEKEEISVNIEEGKLIVTGERKTGESDANKNYTRREFKAQNFERVFSLPENINADEIKAEVRNGILSLTIPKKAEEKKTKQIVVE